MPKRILIIRTGGVGDFILCLPLIRALAVTWPDAELEILGRPAIAVLAQSHVTRITSIDDHRFARLFADTPISASDPAARYLSSFDMVVSFLGGPGSDFGRKLRSLVPRVLFIPPPPSGTRHAVVHFLELLKPIGIEPVETVPRIDLPADARESGARLVRQLLAPSVPIGPVVVHPGSGGRHKNWPPRLFAQTVRLFRRSEHPVILLEGEADKSAVREVLIHLGQDEVPVLRDASLVQVAGVIACSQLVVGNDSGISHVAGAIGTPLVCLFGPTDPSVWRPLGAAVQVITFDEATPERVYEEATRLINGLARTGPH